MSGFALKKSVSSVPVMTTLCAMVAVSPSPLRAQTMAAMAARKNSM